MGFLHKVRLANLDSKLVRHLRAGGNLRDKTTTELIGFFIAEALKDKQIRDIAGYTGFGPRDLCALYIGMHIPLYNPFIKTAATESAPLMMVGSLPFFEPARLEAMLRALRHDVDWTMSDDEKFKALLAFAGEHGKTIFFAHSEARGEPEF